MLSLGIIHILKDELERAFMRYSTDKDINRLVSKMIRSGWTFDRGRHGKLRPPIGSEFITVPKPPSDRRSFQNLKRDIYRLLERTCNTGRISMKEYKL